MGRRSAAKFGSAVAPPSRGTSERPGTVGSLPFSIDLMAIHDASAVDDGSSAECRPWPTASALSSTAASLTSPIRGREFHGSRSRAPLLRIPTVAAGIPIERGHAFRSKAATCSDEGGRGVVASMRSWVRFFWLRQDWRVGR
jgi:hypothetical protein